MSDGDIVGAAHEDSSAIPFGHHAIGFENIEEMVAEFYDEADDTNWHVYQDDYALNNYVADPYSNGMATRVFWS
jgi:flagellar assembly factor FliW